jgi:hypothetical protein
MNRKGPTASSLRGARPPCCASALRSIRVRKGSTLLGACAAICRGCATSRYYRTLVVDGTPSKLAERFSEEKSGPDLTTGKHLAAGASRLLQRFARPSVSYSCSILLQIHQT